MIANILVNFVGILIFLFIFWKKLKEDYTSEIIFSVTASIFVGIVISYIISLNFFPEWFFWFGLLGILLGFLFGIWKFRMKGFEVLDALTVSMLPWVSFVFLKDSVTNSLFSSFLGFIITLLFISIYYFLDLNYKRFTWYKSGRIGFSSLSTLFLIFLTRATLAIKFPTVLSFVVKYEPYLSGFVTLTAAVMIFVLSRNEE